MRGPWTQTFTGRQFWPLDPRPEDVCIEDIAHALSMICRFNGHCREFYSVAQHSVLVSDATGSLWGLMHDAAESYVGDVVRPLKRALQEQEEHYVETAILEALGFWPTLEVRAVVRIADDRMLATEARDLMAPPPADWGLRERPYPYRIDPVGPQEAEASFLARWEELRP